MAEEANPYTQYLEQPEPAPDNPRVGNPFLAPADTNPFEKSYGIAKTDEVDRFSNLLDAMSISERAKSFDTATNDLRMYRLNRDDTPIGSLNGPQRLVARAQQSGQITGMPSDSMSFNEATPAFSANDGTTKTVSEELPWVYGVFGEGWGMLSPEERQAEVKTRRTETLEQIGVYRKYLDKANRAVEALKDDQGTFEYNHGLELRDTATKKLAELDRDLKRYDIIEKDPRRPGMGLDKTALRSGVENTSRAVLDTAVSSTIKFAGIIAGLGGKQFGIDVSEDDNAVFDAGKNIAQLSEQMFPGDVARQQDFSQKLAQGAGSMAAFMGTGALGFLVAGPKAGLGLLALSGGIAQGTSEFDEASRVILAAKRQAEDTYGPIQFTPDERDRLIATGWGFLLGTTEAIPFAGNSTGVGLRGVIGNAARQAPEEAFQEGMVTAGSNVIARYTYDPARELSEDVGESAAVGFVLGGLVGGLTGYRRAPDPAIDNAAPIDQSVPSAGGVELPEGMVPPAAGAAPDQTAAPAGDAPIAGPSNAEVEQAVELWRASQAVEPAVDAASDVVEQATDAPSTVETLVQALPEETAAPVTQALAAVEQTNPGMVDALAEQVLPQAERATAATADMQAELERLGIAQATTEDEVRQILAQRAQPQQAPAPTNPAIAKLTSYLDGGGSLAKSQYAVAARALGVRESELTALLDQAVTSGALRKVGNRYRRTPSAAPRTPQAVKQTVDEVIKKLAPVIPKGTTVKSFAELKDLPASARARLGQASDGVVDPASGNRVDAFEQDGTIYLAQYALNKEGRITHEVMHALVTKGLLSPAEVGLLANRARKAGLFTKETEAQYRAAYAGRANLDALVDEEAAAALVESRADGASYGQKLDTIMDRILAFFKQLGQMLRRRGYRTADEVLDGFFSGEIAQRRAVQEWMRRSSQIRDTDAAFDPANANSPNLMFALSDLADRNNAVLLDDITKDQPHPGRVLALHGTRADFEKFDPRKSRDFGTHFGTQEQSDIFAGLITTREDARVFPVVLEAKTVVDVPDLMTWPPAEVAKEVEAKMPEAAGLVDEVRAAIASGPTEVNMMGRERPTDEAIALGKEALRTGLTKRGVEALRYWNEAEAPGWSYIVWEKGKVKSATADSQPMFALSRDLDMTPESRRERAKAWRHPEGQTDAGKKYFDPAKADSPNLMFAFAVFHGSPHDFRRFSMSYVGSGEGAQVFGKGIYFTQSSDLAKEYHKRLSKPMRTVLVDGQPVSSMALNDLLGDLAGPTMVDDEGKLVPGAFIYFSPEQAASSKAIYLKTLKEVGGKRPASFKNYINESIKLIDFMSGKKVEVPAEQPDVRAGGVYKVEIDADENEFLLWDSSLSEQSDYVRDALEQGGRKALGANWVGELTQRLFSSQENKHFAVFDNKQAGAYVARAKDPERLRENLLSVGIKGIKYRDKATRLAAGGASYNYVVFDDSLIKIVEKNGKPLDDEGLPMFALADRDTGRSMRRDLDALGYYSGALEAAKALKQAKGTPEQMLAQLKAGGAKQNEIEATNLASFLDGKKSVTRDEIVQHLENSRVRLTERVVQRDADNAEMYSVIKERIKEWEDGQLEKANFEYLESVDEYDVDKEIEKWNNFAEQNGGVVDYDSDDAYAALTQAGMKFSSGVIPFWEGTDTFTFGEINGKAAVYYPSNGFEVLKVSVAEYIENLEEEARSVIKSSIINRDPQNMRGQIREEVEQEYDGLDPTKWSSYSLDPKNPTYRETVLHLPESDNNFRSGHFPEPNITGHMMTSMTKHEGRPVYTIDQIQSDWGQKLRDGGVRDEAKIKEMARNLGEARATLDNVLAEANDKLVSIHALQEAGDEASITSRLLFVKDAEKIGGGYRSTGTVGGYPQTEKLPEYPLSPTDRSELNAIFERVQTARSAVGRIEAELRTAEASATGNPLVNTTDQWTNTTLRRALRQAIEADAEFIAIPHGDTVLSYNPGDEGGMAGFYGTRTSEGIVPKNLRKILTGIDKDSPRPTMVETLETPSGMKGQGFTLFMLTEKVKASVRADGLPMFALRDDGPQSLQSIATDLAKDLDLVVRPGLSKTASGRAAKRAGLTSLYDPTTGVIRVQSVTDIQALSEASADALRARFGQPMQDVLTANAAELVPGVPTPADAAINTAFRTWFRDYLISPSLAETNAPNLFDEVEAFLDTQDPTLVAKLNSTQDAIQAYYQADPARFMESVVRDATKPGLWATWNEQRQMFGVRGAISIALNKLYTASIAGKDQPFATAVREVLRIYERNTGTKLDLTAAENPAAGIRLAPHTHAWAARDMEDGIRPYDGIDPRGPALIDALVMALGTDRATARDVGPGSNYRKFGSYLVAKYAAVEWGRFRDGTKPAGPTAMPPGAANPDQAIAFYERVAQTYEASNPDFAQAASLIYDFQQELLTLQYKAGFIGQEKYDELMQDRTYVPFYRAFDEDADLSSRALGSGPNGLLKRKRGSDRDIIDPIAGIAQKVFETRQAISLNDVKKNLLRIADQAGPGGGVIAERLDAKELKGQNIDIEQALESAARDAGVDPRDKAEMMDVMRQVLGNDALATYYTQKIITPGKDPIVFFFEGGEVQAMRLGDGEHGHKLAGQMFEVLNTFGKAHLDTMIEIAALPAQTTRLGVTTHPEFAAANLVRDAVMAFQYDPKATPFYTQLKGMVDVARGAEYVKGFYRTGGMMGGEGTSYADKFRMERDIRGLVDRGYTFKLVDTLPNLVNQLQELVEVRNWRDRAAGGVVGAVAGAAVGGPIGAVTGGFIGATAGAKTLVKLGEVSETATRARLWKHGYDRAIDQGLDQVAAGQEAAFWAHDYTDYSRRGSKMDGLAAVIPFLNANLQGNDVYIRRLLGKGDQGYNPGILFPLYRAGILDITKLSPKQQQELGLSAWTWAMTVFGLGSISAVVATLWDDDERLKDIDNQVKAGHWLIPVGDTVYRVPKPFQTVWFSQIIERWITEGAKGNSRWFEYYLEDLWSTWKPPVVPAVAEVVGTMTGYDINSGRTITPAWSQDKSVGQQFDAYTSPFAKWAGPQMNVSPYYVDHVIHKFGATWGRTFTSLNVPGTAWYDPRKPEKGPEEEFISRRFLWQVGRGSEAGQAIREMMGSDKPLKLITGLLSAPYSKYATSATDYRSLIEKPVPDHAGAVDRLKTMTDKERGFALLEGHFRAPGEIKYRLLHPMNRAERVARETMKIEKEIIGNELLTGKKGKSQKEVPLSPSEKNAARDILTQYRMMEMHNALVLTKETGWERKMTFQVKSVLEELKVASPATYKEMMIRFDKAGILKYDGVAAAWPKFKEKLEDPKWVERVRKNRLAGVKGMFEADYQRARSGRGAGVAPAVEPQELAPVE